MNGPRTAERVADAVLSEGYALYPYRADALKNRYRWQFGVLMPPSYAALPATEDDSLQAEVVVEATAPDATVQVTVRALHVEQRLVRDGAGDHVERLEVGGRSYVTWEQGLLRTIEVDLALARTGPSPLEVDETWAAETETTPVRERGVDVGAVTRTRDAVTLRTRVAVTPLPSGRQRLTVTVRNTTPGEVTDRVDACRRSPVSAHLIIHATGARIASATTPAPDAADEVASCRSTGAWPVLIGARTWSDTVLCAPIILDDDPLIAPESATDLFDGTEIEEMLALRIATLTPAEQQAAAATDPRVAAAVERYLDPMAASSLHARLIPTDTLRSPERAAGHEPPRTSPTLRPGGGPFTAGERVVLRPRAGADAQDRFLAGRAATVVEERVDLEGRTLVAVQVEDDPGAALREEMGRHLYFGRDELERL